MSAPYPRRGNLLFVGMLLLVSVLLEQYAIAPFLPWMGELGSFRPMLVFLDIPLELPRIDWLPVSLLFAVGYSIAIAPELSRIGQRGALRKKVWQALTGWCFLLLLLLAGGGIYYLAQDYLPKQIGNGIDSFGLRADITLPWPYENLIHLHGSMLLLVFFLIGTLVLSRRTAIPAAGEPIAESIATPIAVTPPPQAAYQRPSPASVEAQRQELRPAPPATRGQPQQPQSAPATRWQPQQPQPAAVPPQRQQPQPEAVPPQRQQPQPATAQHEVATPAEAAPTCRYTTPPPVAIIMPRPAIRRMHPCVVSGVVEPKRSRRTTNVLEPMSV